MTLEGYILKDGYPLLISEWCEDGTIIEYISNNPESDYVNIVWHRFLSPQHQLMTFS